MLRIQISSKFIGEADISKDESEEFVIGYLRSHEPYSFFLKEKKVKKVVYIPGKIFNILTDPPVYFGRNIHRHDI